ncbi:MAG: C25 family cysteine peptidase, partial [Euryarchaeota archaeon]|nr:C25 family cysteine peptidase [Euryarchaeota archaeon]
MNNTYVRKHFLQAGIAVMLCIILMIPSFQALAITKETNYTKNESLLSVTEESQSFTFTLQVPSIDISDVTDDDGRTYQKISIPGLDSFFPEDAGGPLIPYLIKYVHIPDNAKDVTVQVQTDGAPSVYRDILVYPCPKSIEKTDDGGNKYLAEEFCFDETKYASQHSAPENLVEIVEVGYLRSVRIGKLRINPVTYDPALKTIKVVHNLDITVQWEKDKDIQTKPDKTEGFEQLMTQSILNYEPPVNTPQKTRSSERGGSVRYITGSQLWDTSIVCDYLVITHQDFFSSPVLADFVNYRATYGNLDVVVVQTSDIGSDYSIKYFVKYAYDYWQTAPQYLLIVGNKQHVPSHQTSDSDGFMDDEKWYVCVAGGDEWADMAMGRFSVENEAELQSIYNKIVYYEQHQLSDKPFFKKALVFQAFCQYAGPVYNTVFNAGFTTTYLNMFYGNYSQDIIDAINSGQDIVYYSGHGSSTSWEIFSIGSLPYLTNTIFPIVMTTACSTADLDAESLGEQFVNIENKGAVAYYGATKAVGQSPTNEILGKIFDNAEYHLGKAIMYGEFMYDTGSRHKIYILLGDPALQSFGYPEDSNNLPDLTVSSSGVNYDCFTQQLTVNVSNIGAVDAYNVLVNVVIVDENAGTNILLGSHVFSVVPAGGEIQSVTLSDIAPPVNGDYSVAVIVDPENAIEESFELNNYNGRRMMISPTFIDITSSSGIYAYTKLVVRGDVNRDG